MVVSLQKGKFLCVGLVFNTYIFRDQCLEEFRAGEKGQSGDQPLLNCNSNVSSFHKSILVSQKRQNKVGLDFMRSHLITVINI